MLKTRYFISSPSVFSTSSYASESRRECIWASPAVGYSSAFNSRNWFFFFCIFRKNEEKKLIFIVKCSRDWVTKLRESSMGGWCELWSRYAIRWLMINVNQWMNGIHVRHMNHGMWMSCEFCVKRSRKEPNGWLSYRDRGNFLDDSMWLVRARIPAMQL